MRRVPRGVVGLASLVVVWACTVNAVRTAYAPAVVHPTAAAIVSAPIVVPSPDAVRVAVVARWARTLGVDPALAIAVSRVENTTARDDAWSPTGCCLGVMQVNVAAHYGEYHALCGGSDLFDRSTNACYGVAILRDKLVQCGGQVTCALRRYVGASAMTPHARWYVAAVLERRDSLRTALLPIASE